MLNPLQKPTIEKCVNTILCKIGNRFAQGLWPGGLPLKEGGKTALSFDSLRLLRMTIFDLLIYHLFYQSCIHCIILSSLHLQ